MPCTEGTFTKVHCSVRGLGRHQEGLSGSWVQMTGAGSLRSGLLRRGQRPTALRQRWALALASLFPEWVRLGGKEDAGPRSCLPGAGPQPSAWTRNRDGRERLSGQAWNAVLPASPPAPPTAATSTQALHLQEATPAHPSLPDLSPLGTLMATPLREDSLRLCWGLERPRPRGRRGPALGRAPRRKGRRVWMPGWLRSEEVRQL